MDIVSGRPDIVLVPRRQGEDSRQRLTLYGLYRRAVVLRAELLGAAFLLPTSATVDAHETAAYQRLRQDLAAQQIELEPASSEADTTLCLDRPAMARALERVLAIIEVRLGLGPEAAAAILRQERNR